MHLTRSTMLAGLVTPFAIGAIACAHRVDVTGFVRVPANCNATATSKLPDVTKGEGAYACVVYVATKMQKPNPKPPVDQWLESTGCQADPSHTDAIEVITTAYSTAGSLDASVGGDYDTHNAFIVAAIENLSDCDATGSIKLKALTKYFLVIRGQAKMAMLVSNGAPPIPLRFQSCTAAGFPPPSGQMAVGDTAFFKSAPDIATLCNHDQVPHGLAPSDANDGSNSTSARRRSRSRGIIGPNAIWLGCVQDCCYAQ